MVIEVLFKRAVVSYYVHVPRSVEVSCFFVVIQSEMGYISIILFVHILCVNF